MENIVHPFLEDIFALPTNQKAIEIIAILGTENQAICILKRIR